jgi:hypothetical protein
MGHIFFYRWRRFWSSGPPVLLAGGTAMITALATVVIASLTSPNRAFDVTVAPPIFLGLVAAIIVTLILLGVQWRFEYRKRTYDPTWALPFNAHLIQNK